MLVRTTNCPTHVKLDQYDYDASTPLFFLLILLLNTHNHLKSALPGLTNSRL